MALTVDKFVDYLEQRWRAFVEGEGNVECGSCRGCCRAGYAIGLSTEEAEIIPHATIAGCAAILPLPNGACPYLVDEQCSIYDHRPVSCRQFDCRDFALASLRINVNLGGAKNQAGGVDEINASIERFHAEHGRLASVGMSDTAKLLVERDEISAVAAGQHAMMMAMLEYLPKGRRKYLVELMCGPQETARGKAMEAVDRMLEAKRGEPA